MPTSFPMSIPHAPTGFVNQAALDAAFSTPINDLYALIKDPTRHGCRATTNVAQTISASTATTLNNNGSAAWTATEDTNGYLTGAGGTTTPIVIPAGLGGLYVVGFHFLVGAVPTGLIWGAGLVNGGGLGTNGFASGWQITRTANSALVSLNAGDTLGVQGFTSTATTISVGSFISCYRISA